jgi:hypothetical protein
MKAKRSSRKREHSLNDKSEKLSVLGKWKACTSPPREIFWGPTIYCSKQNKIKLKTKVKTWYVQNVSTFPNTFAIVCPLICVFWIQLTRTNAVFSRIALVSRFCAEIQLSVKIREKSSKILFHQKTHGARRRDGVEAWGLHTHRGRGPALAVPTWCEGGSAIASTPPSAYIYPFTWKYRGDNIFPR